MTSQTVAQQRKTLQAVLAKFVAAQPGHTNGARILRAANAMKCSKRTVESYLQRPSAGESWAAFVKRKPVTMNRQNLADLARASGCSIDHILSGDGDELPLAKQLAAHLERQLESDPVWQRFAQRFEIAVDGERAITFLVRELREIAADILEHRGETETAMEAVDALANDARDPSGALRLHRKVKMHIATFAPSPAEARAAQLLDWSPGVAGSVAGPDGIRTDRLGGKRRKPRDADGPDAA